LGAPENMSPRILYLGNNRVAWEILKYLKSENANTVGLVVHPEDEQQFGAEITETAALAPECVFDGSELNSPPVLQSIRALRPDLGISVLFNYILQSDFLELFPLGCINLHPSFLPYNRGQYPNVWSIIEGTPAGATLHYVDAGVDTGDIIAQREVPVEAADTGESLYHKLEQCCLDVFREAWPLVRTGHAPRTKQENAVRTHHRTSDVETIDPIDLDRSYGARELINVLRARTFPPYAGAYFVENGRKVYLRLQLLYEDQLDGR